MKKCYIHIGNFKTGSTSLQSFLFLNNQLFFKNKLQTIYEKNYFSNTINNQKLYKFFDLKKFKKIKLYFSKVKKNNNLILSSEYFSCFSYNLEKISYLKNIIEKLGYRPIVLFFYRSDLSYFYSLYSQKLTLRKNIAVDSVFEFINKIKKFGYYFNKKNNFYFLSQNYYINNKIIVKNWKKIFKKDFFYFKFEKKKSNKIFYDFLKILKTKKSINFKIPNNENIAKKIKLWNFKRVFYKLYLTCMQLKIFGRNGLKVNI